MIDKTIKSIVISKKLCGQAEDFKRYKERVKAYKLWREKHSLKDVKVGEKIDVRDTEYIWCVGEVELKITSEKHLPVLYIHYEVIF
jgi:hypothetical protein